MKQAENIARRSKRRRRSKKKPAAQLLIETMDVDFPGAPKDLTEKLRGRLAEAAAAFEAERFQQADKLLATIQKLAPGVPEVHELHGLTFYRLGNWKKALSELESYERLTSSIDQHPIMADCCRALGHWHKAEELWQQLADASPAAEILEEGRIVQAGVLVDKNADKAKGRQEAIRFLEKAPLPKSKALTTVYHLRRMYVLADLYERSGDIAHARKMFKDIFNLEPKFADVAERLDNL